jgi:transposase
MPMLAELVDGVIGVDTHRDTLAAAALTPVGGLLAQTTVRADAGGYRQLLGFARAHVPGRRCWAVEGAGSFGAGLAAFLAGRGERVLEIGRPKRPARHTPAKSDALDAIRAGREALAQERLASPRRRGDREALRVLLACRRGAITARVAATCQLKALIVGAPEELRVQLRCRPTVQQVRSCARLRVRPARSLEHQATVRALCVTARASRPWTPRLPASRPRSLRWWPRPLPGCWRCVASDPSPPPSCW